MSASAPQYTESSASPGVPGAHLLGVLFRRDDCLRLVHDVHELVLRIFEDTLGRRRWFLDRRIAILPDNTRRGRWWHAVGKTLEGGVEWRWLVGKTAELGLSE